MRDETLLEANPIRSFLLGTVSWDVLDAHFFDQGLLVSPICLGCGSKLPSFGLVGLAAPQGVLGPVGSKGGV